MSEITKPIEKRTLKIKIIQTFPNCITGCKEWYADVSMFLNNFFKFG